jgi:cell division protein FtsW (lipid II flippase)
MDKNIMWTLLVVAAPVFLVAWIVLYRAGYFKDPTSEKSRAALKKIGFICMGVFACIRLYARMRR